MVKQASHVEGGRLSAAKLHRHQRVQKMLTSRKEASIATLPAETRGTGCPSKFISSTDSVSSLSDDQSASPSEPVITKQQQRKLRNRQSAEASRQRKRQDAENYRQKVNLLEHENSVLKSLLLQKHPNIMLNQLQQLLPLYTAAAASTIPIDVCRSNEFAIQT
jgi:hypothetical protein